MRKENYKLDNGIGLVWISSLNPSLRSTSLLVFAEAVTILCGLVLMDRSSILSLLFNKSSLYYKVSPLTVTRIEVALPKSLFVVSCFNSLGFCRKLWPCQLWTGLCCFHSSTRVAKVWPCRTYFQPPISYNLFPYLNMIIVASFTRNFHQLDFLTCRFICLPRLLALIKCIGNCAVLI